MSIDEGNHVPSIYRDLYMQILFRDGSSVVSFAVINQSIQIDEYVWHIPCIYQVYTKHIQLFCFSLRFYDIIVLL